MLLLLLGAAPSKHRLAAAAEAYLAGDLRAVEEFEALHAARPEDQEVALWLAIARIEARRCEAGAELLAPLADSARVWAWRAEAQRCLGRPAAEAFQRAYELSLPTDPLRKRVAAGLGLTLVDADAARAASLLAEGGGDPRLHWPDAPALLGVPALPELFFTYGGERWHAVHGLAVPATGAPPDCGLEVTPEGVRKEGDVVVPALAGVADIQARCDHLENIWVLRRDEDGATLLGPEGPRSVGPVVSFDVGAAGLVVELLEDEQVHLELDGTRLVTGLQLSDPELPD